jgi:hypothetical protein
VELELEKCDLQKSFADAFFRLLEVLASEPDEFRFSLAQAQSHQETGVRGEVAIHELL